MPISNQNIINLYDLLAKQDDSNLDHKDFGSVFNFEVAATTIRKIRMDLFAIKDNWDKLSLPEDVENQIGQIIQRLVNVSNQITGFKLDGNSNPGPQRQQILSELKDINSTAYKWLRPITHDISFIALSPETIVDTTHELEKKLSQTEELNKTSSSILESLRVQSGTTGTAVSSQIFMTQASKHKKASWWWLALTLVTFIGTFYTAYASLTGIWPFSGLSIADMASKSAYEIIHIAVVKIILISLVYLTLYQCLKNYNAQKHLEIVNTHRHNALGVYPHMANAVEKELRQVILKEAAHSIFDSGGTGYLMEDRTPPPLNFNEIVNRMPEGR